MPRVANAPAPKGRSTSKQAIATPHKQSPVKLSLNDDRGEKAARLQSRQAIHDAQMNQIRAAASPMRRLNNYDRAASSSPRTPQSAAAVAQQRARENGTETGSPNQLNVVGASAVTPMKRVPILANFEEWMKMATDNKINATNSWNFALIDYFHDMSLLKEGDGVNFQKASCTLDGCVKIYTSRVDSVATETGKLLSGLADGSAKKAKERGEGEEGEEGDEDGEDEDDKEGRAKKKSKKKAQRSHEATLAPSFASLQLKKLELEFAVDPLFKKASADFDEGGAKGLLLNHLSIDSEGRIVFDSSDDAGDASPPGEVSTTKQGQNQAEETTSHDIDLDSLAAKFFPDLAILDSQDICPSMKSFTLGDASSDLNLDFLKPPEDWRDAHKPELPINLADQTGIFLNDTAGAGFDDDDLDGGLLGGFDLPPGTGFGEGGEAWAKDVALEPMLRVGPASDDPSAANDGIVVGDFDPANPLSSTYAVSLNHAPASAHENILSYFDRAFNSQKTGWAGPEHWRIRKIKAAASAASAEPTAPLRPRKEKEPVEIDFLAPMNQALADMIYTPASSHAAISLPKAQWKTKGRNLLPDDRHFNSRSLLTLFLKPKARLGRTGHGKGMPTRAGAAGAAGVLEGGEQYNEMDEAYWARKREEEEGRERQGQDEGRKGDYDANFFADDDQGLPFGGGLPDDVDDDDDNDDGPAGFTDAKEMPSPPRSGADAPSPTGAPMAPGSFGSQLVTQGGQRPRPAYVNYARVAKKVDVRRLKENMWRGMAAGLMSSLDDGRESRPEETTTTDGPPTPAPTDYGDADADADVAMMDVDVAGAVPSVPGTKARELTFTAVMGGLRAVYPEAQLRDISTSYCFICLLHLANEKGLVLEGDAVAMHEILVRRDEAVAEGYVGE